MGEIVLEFFATGKMKARMRTFVILVLKKLDTIESCHYRSISLCTILYKIYTKLMVEIMKLILSRHICSEWGLS